MTEQAPSGQTVAVNRKSRVGTVVSDVNDQTVIVAIERDTRHRLYRKVIRQTKRYPVHDPKNAATLGDVVRIEECRPISKTKHWRLVEVLTTREVAEVAAEEIDVALVDEVQRTAARAASESAETTDEAEGAPGASATTESVTEPAAEVAEPAAGAATAGSTAGNTDEGADTSADEGEKAE